MVLNKKQKQYLFTSVINNGDKIKLFETTNMEWLLKRKVELGKDDGKGWRDLMVNNELVTTLNFSVNVGHIEALENIDDYEQCQWCEEWFSKDEIVYRRRGFTKLCHHCNDYLISRGEL